MTRWIKSLTLAAFVAIGLGAALPGKAAAQEYYIGQIFLGGWNFCPRGSAFANGALLPISDYTAVFAVLGTAFGGDGRTTFALPDLRGRTPLAPGQSPGLSRFHIGQKGGAESTALNSNQLAAHTHALTGTLSGSIQGSSSTASTGTPTNAAPAITGGSAYASGPPAPMADGTVSLDLSGAALSSSGEGQSFGLRDPYLALQYCIALQGIFPTRN
ncbi:MAG: tail fiber protein [Pseudomonadota bacterium]